MTYIVVVEGEAGGWCIDPKELTAAICARWTDVEIDPTHRSAVQSLMWRFETEYGAGEAYLHEDGTCLYMDVWEDDAIWLATIFRGLTPAARDLVFCDEGCTFDVRVVAGCPESELAELVAAAA